MNDQNVAHEFDVSMHVNHRVNKSEIQGKSHIYWAHECCFCL